MCGITICFNCVYKKIKVVFYNYTSSNILFYRFILSTYFLIKTMNSCI